jgi:hypothetical protein
MIKVAQFPKAGSSQSGSGASILLFVFIIVAAFIYFYHNNQRFKASINSLLGFDEPQSTVKTTTTVKTSSGANAPVTNYVGKRFMNNPFVYEREMKNKQF